MSVPKSNAAVESDKPPQSTIYTSAKKIETERIGFSKSYLKSISGILRLTIIIFQFVSWICAAAALSNYGFLIAVFLYFMHILNIVNDPFFKRVPWNHMTIVLDIIWFMTSFALAVTAAVAESRNYYKIREGAFGMASAFGFICMFLYIADAVVLIRIISPTLFASNSK